MTANRESKFDVAAQFRGGIVAFLLKQPVVWADVTDHFTAGHIWAARNMSLAVNEYLESIGVETMAKIILSSDRRDAP